MTLFLSEKTQAKLGCRAEIWSLVQQAGMQLGTPDLEFSSQTTGLPEVTPNTPQKQ